MALVLRPEAQHWVAAVKVNGRLCRLSLTQLKDGVEVPIPIEGQRPSSLKKLQEGDKVFLHSYYTALAKHDILIQELKSQSTEEELTKRLIKARTGKSPNLAQVSDLPSLWRRLPRKRKPSKRYLQQGKSVLGRFVEFMENTAPEVKDVYGIKVNHLRSFFEEEDARGISSRSWNTSVKFLKSVLKHEAPDSIGYKTYLKKLLLREEQTVHRKPFNDEQLSAILEAVKEDDLLRGPVITAMCSGMRKGDCCSLKWKSVDLENNFIEIQTAKTKENCEIPILPLLNEELQNLKKKPDDEYVFPEAASLYNDPKKRHLLNTRFMQMMRRAGFTTPPKAKNKATKVHPNLQQVDKETLLERAEIAMAGKNYQQRKVNIMRQALALYTSGMSLPQVSEELQVSKSTVSLHLNTLEEITGNCILRRPTQTGDLGATVITAEGQRLKRGSLIGWHSFRGNFITRALSAGMPEEMVRRVTGHTTVDIMREHYLHPNREDFKREFERVASKLLVGNTVSDTTPNQESEILSILENMTAKSWKKDRDVAIQLLTDGIV